MAESDPKELPDAGKSDNEDPAARTGSDGLPESLQRHAAFVSTIEAVQTVSIVIIVFSAGIAGMIAITTTTPDRSLNGVLVVVFGLALAALLIATIAHLGRSAPIQAEKTLVGMLRKRAIKLRSSAAMILGMIVMAIVAGFVLFNFAGTIARRDVETTQSYAIRLALEGIS